MFSAEEFAQFKEEKAAGTFQATQKRDPLPAGEYKLALVDCEHDPARPIANGTTAIVHKLKWEVSGGEHEGRWVFDDHWIFNSGTRSEQAKRIIFSIFMALGAETLAECSEGFDAFIGRTIKAEIFHEEWSRNGKSGTATRIKPESYAPVQAPTNPVASVNSTNNLIDDEVPF